MLVEMLGVCLPRVVSILARKDTHDIGFTEIFFIVVVFCYQVMLRVFLF